MSYQVLARKWRPQNFKQMVGQEHVLQALIHALESGRLHHAYLFTGTRGVGKTTIGRILAKCLSCHTGITAEPCGECGACRAITEGRYVDLIEIDAASRTKVEDMRELLDNVQYAPTEGKYKIYLIDEVHMLSQSSFNALLKTLEEPPEHVKFLFATTDPQKLPVTILSRCLQFNLKNMSPERIVEHLKHILAEEAVVFEEPALWALARAADGSMRDALSLTDQAIAYGNHSLSEQGVSSMLGTIDQKRIYRILDALVSGNASRVLEEVKALAEFSPDYASVLANLSSILHRVAIEQAVPGATDNAMGDRDNVISLAKALSAEDLQLFYQISLVSRQDLAITPDPRAGLEMALLRMMAFQLEPAAGDKLQELSADDGSTPEAGADNRIVQAADAEAIEADQSTDSRPVDSGPGEEDASASVSAAANSGQSVDALSDSPSDLPPVEAYAETIAEAQDSDDDSEAVFASQEAKKKTLIAEESEVPHVAPPSERELTGSVSAATETPGGADIEKTENAPDPGQDEWPKIASQMPVSGMTQNLLLNMAFSQIGDKICLNVEPGHYRLLNANHESRIREAIETRFGSGVTLSFVEGLEQGQETPMMWRARKREQMLDDARLSLKNDPNVLQILEVFDAILVEDSIQALGELH